MFWIRRKPDSRFTGSFSDSLARFAIFWLVQQNSVQKFRTEEIACGSIENSAAKQLQLGTNRFDCAGLNTRTGGRAANGNRL